MAGVPTWLELQSLLCCLCMPFFALKISMPIKWSVSVWYLEGKQEGKQYITPMFVQDFISVLERNIISFKGVIIYCL